MLIELEHIVKSGFVPILSLALVVSCLVEQIFAGLLVGHLGDLLFTVCDLLFTIYGLRFRDFNLRPN